MIEDGQVTLRAEPDLFERWLDVIALGWSSAEGQREAEAIETMWHRADEQLAHGLGEPPGASDAPSTRHEARVRAFGRDIDVHLRCARDLALEHGQCGPFTASMFAQLMDRLESYARMCPHRALDPASRLVNGLRRVTPEDDRFAPILADAAELLADICRWAGLGVHPSIFSIAPGAHDPV